MIDDGLQYTQVQGDRVQSAASNYCGCGTSDTDETSWTGLGGWFSGSLLQEGTDMQGTPANIFPWYEYLHPCPGNPSCNPNEIQIVGLNVQPGMNVHTYSAYATATGNAYFMVCAGGYCQSALVQLDNSYFDGRTADFIDERPQYCLGGCYKPLTNFGYNDWTGSAWSVDTGN